MAVTQGSTARMKLSGKHGGNVDLNKAQTKASWVLKLKGGYSFITSPLADRESCVLKVMGSGHAYLGVTSSLPRSPEFDHKTDSAAKRLLLRQKKSSARWCVRREGQTVTVSELDKHVASCQWTMSGDDITVTVEILFGDINFEIIETSKERVFFAGENIKLSCEKRRISSRESRSAIRCSSERCLLQGEIIMLQLQPLPDSNWVSCKLFLSNCSPEDLLDDENKSMRLVPIKRVKRAGDLHLQVVKDEVNINFLMKRDSVRLSELDVHKPIYLHAEIFRMKMKVRSILPGNKPLPPYQRVIPTSDDRQNNEEDLDNSRDEDYCVLAQPEVESGIETLGPISDDYFAMIDGDLSSSGLPCNSQIVDPDNTEPKTLDDP